MVGSNWLRQVSWWCWGLKRINFLSFWVTNVMKSCECIGLWFRFDLTAGMSSLVMYSYGSPHMARQKQDDQHEHTFSSYVRIRYVALKTCQRRWTIGKSGERGSGISVLVARHDDDDLELRLSWNHEERETKNYFYFLPMIYIIISSIWSYFLVFPFAWLGNDYIIDWNNFIYEIRMFLNKKFAFYLLLVYLLLYQKP